MLPGKKYTPDDYLRIIWRRRWFIAIPLVVIASATLVVSMFLPNRYRASTSILIVPQRVPETFVRPTVTDGPGRAAQHHQPADPQPHAARAHRAGVQPLRARAPADDHGRRHRAHARGTSASTSPGPAAGATRSTTSASRSRPPSPERRCGSPSAWRRCSSRRTSRTAKLLADQTDQFLRGAARRAQRRRLRSRRRSSQEFRHATPAGCPTRCSRTCSCCRARSRGCRRSPRPTTAIAIGCALLERQLAEMPAVVGEPGACRRAAPRGGGEQSQAMTAAQQLEVARAELRALELRLKPEHPDIGRAKRVIAELEAKAEAEALQQPLSAVTPAPASNPVADRERAAANANRSATRSTKSGRGSSPSAARRRACRSRSPTCTARVQAGPGLQSELTELMRDYSTLQDGYTALLRKSEESKIAVQLERRQIGEQFKIIDGARLPERPISPDRVRINMFGILGGLALGLGAGRVPGVPRHQLQERRRRDDHAGAAGARRDPAHDQRRRAAGRRGGASCCWPHRRRSPACCWRRRSWSCGNTGWSTAGSDRHAVCTSPSTAFASGRST